MRAERYWAQKGFCVVKPASIHPRVAGDTRGTNAPGGYPTRRDSRHTTLALGPGLEIGMPQPCSLTLKDILVEHDQAETGLSRYSSACFTIARPAMRMASAIAGREMLPWPSLMMSSQLRPAATSSRTSLTRIRVPRNVSLPWQTLGLAVMNRPIAFVFIRRLSSKGLV